MYWESTADLCLAGKATGGKCLRTFDVYSTNYGTGLAKPCNLDSKEWRNDITAGDFLAFFFQVCSEAPECTQSCSFQPATFGIRSAEGKAASSLHPPPSPTSLMHVLRRAHPPWQRTQVWNHLCAGDKGLLCLRNVSWRPRQTSAPHHMAISPGGGGGVSSAVMHRAPLPPGEWGTRPHTHTPPQGAQRRPPLTREPPRGPWMRPARRAAVTGSPAPRPAASGSPQHPPRRSARRGEGAQPPRCGLLSSPLPPPHASPPLPPRPSKVTLPWRAGSSHPTAPGGSPVAYLAAAWALPHGERRRGEPQPGLLLPPPSQPPPEVSDARGGGGAQPGNRDI